MKPPDPTRSESGAPNTIMHTSPVCISVKDKPGNPLISHALKTLPVTWELINHLAGCGKSREFVAELHSLGHDVSCASTKKTSCDLFDCWPGVYYITQQVRRHVNRWLTGRKA